MTNFVLFGGGSVLQGREAPTLIEVVVLSIDALRLEDSLVVSLIVGWGDMSEFSIAVCK